MNGRQQLYRMSALHPDFKRDVLIANVITVRAGGQQSRMKLEIPKEIGDMQELADELIRRLGKGEANVTFKGRSLLVIFRYH